MKILLLTPTKPGNRSFGAAQRSNDLRSALIRRNTVDTLLIEGGPTVQIDAQWSKDADGQRVARIGLTQFGLNFQAWRQRRAASRLIDRIVADGQYDMIVARYVGMANFVPMRHRDKLIVDGDDLSSTVAASVAGVLPRIKIMMRVRVANTARRVWVVRARDAGLLHQGKAIPLPNAVRLPMLEEIAHRDPGSIPTILMVGLFEYAPNADGARWFIEHVAPQLFRLYPKLTVRIVGRHPPDFLGEAPERVKVLGFVDDLAAEYSRASLVIAPIRTGGGTQIKVLEALGHACPVVTTPFVADGFAGALRQSEHLLIADGAAEWLKGCQAVLDDRQASQAMADRGRAQVASLFGQDRFQATVDATLEAWR